MWSWEIGSDKISLEVNDLFSQLCYEIDEIKVEIIDDNQTVYIEFSGADSALLIGKEGEISCKRDNNTSSNLGKINTVFSN